MNLLFDLDNDGGVYFLSYVRKMYEMYTVALSKKV